MEIKKVQCPYDGIDYRDVPGGFHKSPECPYCGGKSPNPEAHWSDVIYVHQKVERTLLTQEEAMEIFRRYVKKQFYKALDYTPGKDLFNIAWYSQHWPTYERDKSYHNPEPKRDWMGDDLLLAFEWYLDAVGRDLGYGHGHAKGIVDRKVIEKMEKELNALGKELRHKRWEQQRAANERREKQMQEKGENLVKSLKIGDVVMVKFNCVWNYRPLQVLEIEDSFIAGFYLDPVDKEVPNGTLEKPGYRYTKEGSVNIWPKDGSGYAGIVKGKLEWDGKTMKKTRSYVSKDTKFIKEKIENPVIKK